MSTMVRVSDGSKVMLKAMAKKENLSLQKMLDRIIENEQQRFFLRNVGKQFETLKQNKKVWQEEQAERELSEQTLLDNQEE